MLYRVSPYVWYSLTSDTSALGILVLVIIFRLYLINILYMATSRWCMVQNKKKNDYQKFKRKRLSCLLNTILLQFSIMVLLFSFFSFFLFVSFFQLTSKSPVPIYNRGHLREEKLDVWHFLKATRRETETQEDVEVEDTNGLKDASLKGTQALKRASCSLVQWSQEWVRKTRLQRQLE